MKRSTYIMIARVNDAGKSTLYGDYPELFSETERLNADEILKKSWIGKKIRTVE